MTNLGKVINNAMKLVELQSKQLINVLFQTYTRFYDKLLCKLLRVFKQQRSR